tara:strand:- start:102 stop:860 length:759 start_codon:yes stop_codon:yes gene_type:complete
MNKEYYYIYNISYWTGNNRLNNIYEHISYVKSCKEQGKKNLVVISVAEDTEEQEMRSKINSFSKEQDDDTDIKILYRKNTGGTVRAMWELYKLLEKENVTSKYFCTTEDDFICTKPVESFQPYFDKGMTWIGSYWFEDSHKDEKEYEKTGIKKMSTNYAPFLQCSYPEERLPMYRWTEDPYIMPFENLKKIEDAIGIFTLAPEQEHFLHGRHGVFFGEVGFPSRAYMAGLRYRGLRFSEYFKFLNKDSNWNK